MFRGSEYIKFWDGDAKNMVEGYPKPICGNWDVPESWCNGIDSAIFSTKYDAIYMFKDDEYHKIPDGNAQNAVDGYPKSLSGNWDLPEDWIE